MAKLVIKCEGMPAEAIELKNGLNRFGRSSKNDFQIFHESVSRFHCEIELKNDGMVVRDMDSSNGTFVNDQVVSEAILETGNVVRLGEVTMEVREAPAVLGKKGTGPCSIHPNLAASMVCTECGKKFCGSCVHLLRCLDGQFLRLCPVCSGHCEPLRKVDAPRKSVMSKTRLLGRKPDEPSAATGYSR